jgi:hypothetical protein
MTTTLADEMLADLDHETGDTHTRIDLGHVTTPGLTPTTPLQDIHPDTWNDLLTILGVMDRNGEDSGMTLNQLTRQARIRDGLYESDQTTALLLGYLAATGRVHKVELSRHDHRAADRWFLGPNPNAATGPAAPLDNPDPALDDDDNPWTYELPTHDTTHDTEPAPF